MNIEEIRNDKGELPAYAWPGGYPMVYMAKDNGILCPKCANAYKAEKDNEEQLKPVGYFIHYEGTPEQCEHCNAFIESAYGDPNESKEVQS